MLTLSDGQPKISAGLGCQKLLDIGLYEFYSQVPPGLANGDYQIHVAQNGTPLPQTLFLTVQN